MDKKTTAVITTWGQKIAWGWLFTHGFMRLYSPRPLLYNSEQTSRRPCAVKHKPMGGFKCAGRYFSKNKKKQVELTLIAYYCIFNLRDLKYYVLDFTLFSSYQVSKSQCVFYAHRGTFQGLLATCSKWLLYLESPGLEDRHAHCMSQYKKVQAAARDHNVDLIGQRSQTTSLQQEHKASHKGQTEINCQGEAEGLGGAETLGWEQLM